LPSAERVKVWRSRIDAQGENHAGGKVCPLFRVGTVCHSKRGKRESGRQGTSRGGGTREEVLSGKESSPCLSKVSVASNGGQAATKKLNSPGMITQAQEEGRRKD